MSKRLLAWLLALVLILMVLTAATHAVEHFRRGHVYEECPVCIALVSLFKAVGRLAATLSGFLLLSPALRRFGLKAVVSLPFIKVLSPVCLKVKLSN